MRIIKYMALSAVIVMWACNKNQKVVKELDGDWKITAVTANGTPDHSYDNNTMHFEKCKVKKGDCPGSISDGTFTIPFTYNVSDKGKKFNWTVVTDKYSADIEEHSDSKFKFKQTEDGDVMEYTLEKK